MVDYMIPVLNPAGVQEILDFGLIGFALSRYAGVWVGIKCVKDNIESTATVDGRIDRVAGQDPRRFHHAARRPQHPRRRPGARQGSPPARLQARRHSGLCPRQQARPHRHERRRHARRSASSRPARATSTSAPALDDLGIDEVKANELGLRLYKVGMVWPLEPRRAARVRQGPRSHHRRRGEARADRDAGQGAALRLPTPPASCIGKQRRDRRPVASCSRPRARSSRPTSRSRSASG